MATDIILLRLGSTTMESAVVLEWLAEVGESVTEGDAIVILEADKVEIELPAPATGVLLTAAEVGSEVAVGAPVGTIGSEEEAAAALSASPGGDAGEPVTQGALPRRRRMWRPSLKDPSSSLRFPTKAVVFEHPPRQGSSHANWAWTWPP